MNYRVEAHLLRWLRALLVGLMAALVASVSWQVLSRYLLGAPSEWTEEAARFLLVWLGMLGAAYVYPLRLHLAIDIVARRSNSAIQRRLEHVVAVAVALFALGVMVVGGGYLVMLTGELAQMSPALGVPMALIYAVIPVAGVLLSLFSVLQLLRDQAQRTVECDVSVMPDSERH